MHSIDRLWLLKGATIIGDGEILDVMQLLDNVLCDVCCFSMNVVVNTKIL